MSFKLEVWKFPVPFGISTRFESTPAVPLVVKSYKMAASLSSGHYTGCKMIRHSSNLFLIESENVWFPRKLWTGRYEFPVGLAYSAARKVRKFLSYKISTEGRVEFWMRVNFSTWSSLIGHLRQPLHHYPSAFSRVILGGKCAQAGTERDRSGLWKIPFHSTYGNFGNSETGIFGRMERAHELHKSWRKCWKSQVSFCHQSSPVSRKAWTLPWISQEFKNTLGKGAFGHSIRVLNERSVSDGGNLCPLWLEILKSLGYSDGDAIFPFVNKRSHFRNT